MRAPFIPILLLFPTLLASADPAWKNGPPTSPDYFPIAVWLQEPRNAPKYQAIGINLYVGLWSGPNEAQLAELEKNKMPVICGQNLKFVDRKIIVGWMHGDEPDNAQSLPKGKGYGPPIATDKIVADYKKISAADPTRPVMLNLGQGVAYDNYIGRGVRRNKMEDYPLYVQGSDIVSFDIYPVNHDKPEIAGKLEYVPRGVTRLIEWGKGQKIVWNCIECGPIENAKAKPTAEQIKSEVWMSIIHGSRGLIYFVHQFKPKFIEAGLLANPEIAKAVGQINEQVRTLAPAVNSNEIVANVIADSPKDTPVDFMARRAGGATYLFAVGMRNAAADATFTVPGIKGPAEVEVLGESRTLKCTDGRFQDSFSPYAVHLYKMK